MVMLQIYVPPSLPPSLLLFLSFLTATGKEEEEERRGEGNEIDSKVPHKTGGRRKGKEWNGLGLQPKVCHGWRKGSFRKKAS